MTLQYKFIKKTEETNKYRRLHRTEPTEIFTGPSQAKELQAKECLMDLNKELEQMYYPHHSRRNHKFQYSLSQWSQPYRKTQKVKEKQDWDTSLRQEKKKASEEASHLRKDYLSTFEKELILPQRSRLVAHRSRANWSETGQRNNQSQVRQKLFEIEHSKPLRDIQVMIHKSPQKCKKLKRGQVYSKIKAHCLLLSGSKTLKSHPVTDHVSQQKEIERLPRLDRMQAQLFKQKYKYAFRQNTPLKYSLPLESFLCKDIIQINQLIKEENVKLGRQSVK